MNKKLILSASITLVLTACSSGTYITDVKTESHQEEYKTSKIEPPMFSEAEMAAREAQAAQQVVATPTTPVTTTYKTIVDPEQTVAKPVKIVPPTKKQVKAAARFGYTVQVAAVPSETKVIPFAAKLPQQVQPIWQHYKVVNGTKWYTVLFGDYATSAEASQAIKTLSPELKALKPFVKSIDSIKNSNYPTMKKLN